ncbi:major facilitator superfamily domain-containing protein [Microdochium trichocladiopsis]|uniref:Major facilitator superfamily domain-containing protein n=1 Tax=Microdochium trichocladiopsis TaxID=1682393 RepID=A0A9P9BQ22_9PEZI|nr:major facilitator superfamily domain-containing protein [Microdochium trichocladiopsis]KAH7033699.1 major facilitator superfamily domain-containing protein [Microdochium trichocladiopsis]
MAGHNQHSATEATPLLAASPVAPAAAVVEAGTFSRDNTLVGDALSSSEPSSRETHQGSDDDDDDDDEDDHSDADSEHEEPPLRRGQVMLLCYARMVEPIAFFSIFPYINQMLERNGSLAPADVGFYSGLIESMFSLTQMCVMMFWGHAADRFGRKPILVFSLVAVSVATALFGLAQSIWQMVLFRCVAGVFAGTIVTIRVMITEHSTQATQARTFSWFAFAGNLGILFGPLLGGVLADPAAQYPAVFAGVPFFEKFPYALSSFVVGLIGLSAAVTSALFVEETLPAEVRAATAAHNAIVEDSEQQQDPNGNSNKPPEQQTWRSLLREPGVGAAFYTYGHVMILAFAYTAIVPVFWYTPPELGGFGFTYLLISSFMALNGFSQATWLLLIFPRLQRRFGTNGVIQGCAVAWPFFFALMPFLNTLLRIGTPFADNLFWTIAVVAMLVGPGVAMAFTGIQLLLNDVAPDPLALSTLNAMALALTSGLRSFSPALFTSIFAFSVNNQWLLAGHFSWLVLLLIALGLAGYVLVVGLPVGEGRALGGAARVKKAKEVKGKTGRKGRRKVAVEDVQDIGGAASTSSSSSSSSGGGGVVRE